MNVLMASEAHPFRHLCSAAVVLALLGCGIKADGDGDTIVGEEFLSSCTEICENGFTCVDGACTQACSAHSECGDLGESVGCQNLARQQVCDVLCVVDEACEGLGEDFSCFGGRCRAEGFRADEGTCLEGGERHSDGDNWPCSDGCNTCYCQEGRLVFSQVSCGPLLPCEEGGNTYEHEESWECSDGCNTCSCINGVVNSTDISCPAEEL